MLGLPRQRIRVGHFGDILITEIVKSLNPSTEWACIMSVAAFAPVGAPVWQGMDERLGVVKPGAEFVGILNGSSPQFLGDSNRIRHSGSSWCCRPGKRAPRQLPGHADRQQSRRFLDSMGRLHSG